MAEANLHVEYREKTGHSTSKSMRAMGKVPAIFYFHQEKPVTLSLDEKELIRLLQTESNIINTIFPDGNEKKSILREVQRDPVNNRIVHVDIMGIMLTEKVRLSIPITLIGIPAGVKDGGVLEHLLREVEVEGLPLEIPEHLEISVADLNIGQSVLLRDIHVEKIKFLQDLNHAVAIVTQPKVVKEVVEAPVEGEVEAEGEAGAEEEKEEKE